MSRHATITGTGCHLPGRVVTNVELSARLGEDIDPFVWGTLGIRERRICGPEESTADLAPGAACLAMGSLALRWQPLAGAGIR